jgi:hypothetical protein
MDFLLDSAELIYMFDLTESFVNFLHYCNISCYKKMLKIALMHLWTVQNNSTKVIFNYNYTSDR